MIHQGRVERAVPPPRGDVQLMHPCCRVPAGLKRSNYCISRHAGKKIHTIFPSNDHLWWFPSYWTQLHVCTGSWSPLYEEPLKSSPEVCMQSGAEEGRRKEDFAPRGFVKYLVTWSLEAVPRPQREDTATGEALLKDASKRCQTSLIGRSRRKEGCCVPFFPPLLNKDNTHASPETRELLTLSD